MIPPLLILLALLAWLIFAVVKACTRKTIGWIAAAVVSGVLLLGTFGLGSVMLMTKLIAAAKDQDVVDQVLSSKDGRYSLSVPRRWKAKPQLHKNATIGAGSVLEDQLAMLIVEDKADLNMDLEQFAEVVIDHTMESLSEPRKGAAEPLTIGGHPAVRHRVSGRLDGVKLTYHFTLVDTGDALCQIICWTALVSDSIVAPRFEAIAKSFVARPSATFVAGSDTYVADSLTVFISEQLGVEVAKVTPAARLTADLGADDLDLVEIVMLVEEEYDLSVTDSQAESWQTVGDIIRFVEKRFVQPKVKERK